MSYETFGRWLQAIAGRGDIQAAAGMSGSVDSDGGYLLPALFAEQVAARTYETGAILSRCRRTPTPTTNRIQIPKVSESSRNAGSRFGGMQCYWLNEGATVTAAKPKFGRMELKLSKLVGLAYVTDELLQDAPQLEATLLQVTALEASYLIEGAIVDGTGAGQPLGLLRSAAKITVSKDGSQTATTITAGNVKAMYARLWGPSRRNAVWLANQDADAQLLGLADSRLYNPDGNATSDGYPTLCGRPVLPVEHCPTLGTEGDLVFCDLSQYVVADRLQSVLSMHVRFLEDEGAFRLSWRIDGQPTWESALTPDNGTSTLSPFVTVETRE